MHLLAQQTPLLLHQSSQTEIHLQDIPAKAWGNSIPPPYSVQTLCYYGNYSYCSSRLPSNWPVFEDTRGNLLLSLSLRSLSSHLNKLFGVASTKALIYECCILYNAPQLWLRLRRILEVAVYVSGKRGVSPACM